MAADLINHLYIFWTKIKEFLPLSGPVIALSIFAYNQATRKRKHLHIEEFKGKGLSLNNTRVRLNYLRIIFKSSKIAAFSFKWLGGDHSKTSLFQNNGYVPPVSDKRWSVQLVFINASTDEIKVSDYEQPFRIHFKTAGNPHYQIRIMPIVTTPANLHIQLHTSRDNITGEPVVEISPVLLNPGDGFTLKIAADRVFHYQLTYRIMGVKSNLFCKKLSYKWIMNNGFYLNIMIRILQAAIFLSLYNYLIQVKYNRPVITTSDAMPVVVIIALLLFYFIVTQLWVLLFHAEKVVRREVIRGNTSAIKAFNQFLEEQRNYERL